MVSSLLHLNRILLVLLLLVGSRVVGALKFPGYNNNNQNNSNGSVEAPLIGPSASEANFYSSVQDVCDMAMKNSLGFNSMDFMPFLCGLADADNPFSILQEKLLLAMRYKPPVGIIALLTLTQLILSGRLFRLFSDLEPQNSVQAVLQKQAGKRFKFRTSFVLDRDDVNYRRFGGIDRVRQKLTVAALSSSSSLGGGGNKSEDPSSSARELREKLVSYCVSALSVDKPGSRRDLVVDMIQQLSHIEALLYNHHPGGTTLSQQPDWRKQVGYRLGNLASQVVVMTKDNNDEQTLEISIHLVQMRAMDALLRVCRDRLLRTCHRLARTVDYWSHHLESAPTLASILPRMKSKNVEEDRLRLAYAKAAYQAEIERLGMVSKLLLKRPRDMPEKALLQVLQATELARQNDKARRKALKRGGGGATSPTESKPRPSLASRMTRIPQIMTRKFSSLSKYSLQWGAESSMSISLRKIESGGTMDPIAAQKALLEHGEPDQWLKKVSEWTNQGRQTISQVLQDSLKGASFSGRFDEAEFQDLQQRWCQCQTNARSSTISAVNSAAVPRTQADFAKDWMRILQYADSLPLWRRVGEGRVVRLEDAAVVSWTRRINVMGLPLACLQISLAYLVHRIVSPHWGHFREEVLNIYAKVVDILIQRCWIPLKGLYDEIMNQSYSLMEGFVLELEEQTLDHMLRDSGFGDGTKAARAKALEDATFEYERDIARGMMLNFATGKLINLLLIQTQQLKVGMLQALNYIDILMKGNQIHFQLLAVIPAAILLWFGTRFFIRALYNIRSKDLRPVTAAHVEMSTYLNQVECLALLSSSSLGENGNEASETSEQDSTAVLGEILLYMHRYLILLDFSSSLVPARAREDVRRALQQLVALWGDQFKEQERKQRRRKGEEQSEQSRITNMQWIRLVKERHSRLDQYF